MSGIRNHSALQKANRLFRGANWIHGTEGNPIDQISRISNTTTCEWDGRETIYDTNGKLLDEATTMKLAEWMWTTVDEGFVFSTKNKDSIPAGMSLFDYCCKQLEKTNFTEEEKAACKEFSKFWGAYVGEPVERQSMKFFCLEECIEGSKLSQHPLSIWRETNLCSESVRSVYIQEHPGPHLKVSIKTCGSSLEFARRSDRSSQQRYQQ